MNHFKKTFTKDVIEKITKELRSYGENYISAIVKQTGYSRTTVSKYFNGSGDIGQVTEMNIIDAALLLIAEFKAKEEKRKLLLGKIVSDKDNKSPQ